MKYIKILIVAVLFVSINSCRKSDYIAENNHLFLSDNGTGVGTTTWSSDKEYLLEGFVFVNDGQVLTIEPGTVIRFKKGQGVNASALIVARGGKIIAQGTADNPIIFTSEDDDLQGSIPLREDGLWGGIIILGNANLNNNANEGKIEGIPVSEPRGIYGGSSDEDNSGVLSYVSIRHSGSILGQGNEINGLTLGGVGSNTTINHVEIVSNSDDGIEIFGGTVNLKNIAAAFCEDDGLDTDLGYRGKIQYILVVQDSIKGDLLAEHDGGTNPVLGQPYSIPVIANATYIGKGENETSSVMVFSDNAGGKYFNSIFLNQRHGVKIEFVNNSYDSYQQWINGNLEINSNIFYSISSDTSTSIFSIVGDYPGASAVENWQNYFYSAHNTVQDPGIFVSANYIEPIPKNNVSQGLANINDPFFDKVNYKGAFGNINWLSGWSLLDESGFVR